MDNFDLKKYLIENKVTKQSNLNEEENNNSVYDFVKQNINVIKKSLNIQNISEFDGDDEMAHIADDDNYITWTFSFNPSTLEDIETLVEKIKINGKLLYYVEGKG